MPDARIDRSLQGPDPTPSSGPAPLLLIEDMPSLQLLYGAILRKAGHRVRLAGSAAEGLAAFAESGAEVVLLDLGLPDRDGLALMADLQALRPEARIVIVTANGSISKAVEAMRSGAHDFLVKPFEEARFLSAVGNALVRRPPAPPPSAPPAPVQVLVARGAANDGGRGAADSMAGIIGQSEPMLRLQAQVRSVARSMATVFLTGESGTGKDLCAMAIHAASDRAEGPFVTLNCGAIPPDQLESEVFGHSKGAAAFAQSDKAGAAVAADEGTLFLDEICELDLALQTRLLRFLHSSTVTPLGSSRPRKVNVRILCATNADPQEAVRRGRFRQDLYYRLFVVPIHMPPLRDRGEDVILIAEDALARYAAEEGRRFTGLDPEVRALFRRLPWPGNVRQVLNVIRNVVVMNEGPTVLPHMLPPDLLRADLLRTEVGLTETLVPPAAGATLAAGPDDPFAGHTLAEIERRAIDAALARHEGSVPRAARELDIAPSTLYRKLEARAKG